MNSILNKGDIVKTSLSDSTLVLKVKDNDVLLFTGDQFVVAHGVQKNDEKVFWNQGDYYDELPNNIFDDKKKNFEDIKDLVNNLVDRNYKEFVMALISIERGINDKTVLDDIYDRYMDNDDINLINDFFNETLEDDWELEP